MKYAPYGLINHDVAVNRGLSQYKDAVLLVKGSPQ